MLAIMSSLGLQVVAYMVPGLRRLLGVGPLGLADIAAIGAGAALPLLLNELAKPRDQSRTANKAMAARSISLSTNAEAMSPANLRPTPEASAPPA